MASSKNTPNGSTNIFSQNPFHFYESNLKFKINPPDLHFRNNSKIKNNSKVVISRSESKATYKNRFCFKESKHGDFYENLNSNNDDNNFENINFEDYGSLEIENENLISDVTYRWNNQISYMNNLVDFKKAIKEGSRYCFN